MDCPACCWCKHLSVCSHRCVYIDISFETHELNCSYEESDICPDFESYFSPKKTDIREDYYL